MQVLKKKLKTKRQNAFFHFFYNTTFSFLLYLSFLFTDYVSCAHFQVCLCYPVVGTSSFSTKSALSSAPNSPQVSALSSILLKSSRLLGTSLLSSVQKSPNDTQHLFPCAKLSIDQRIFPIQCSKILKQISAIACKSPDKSWTYTYPRDTFFNLQRSTKLMLFSFFSRFGSWFIG